MSQSSVILEEGAFGELQYSVQLEGILWLAGCEDDERWLWMPVNAGRRSGNDSSGPTTMELKWFFAFSIAVVATLVKCKRSTCEKVYSSRRNHHPVSIDVLSGSYVSFPTKEAQSAG
jgi:hypothetical protein